MCPRPGRKRGSQPHFRYFEPAKKRASQYEEVTVHTQWDPKNYAAQGWFNLDSQGRGAWHDDSTELRSENWWGYRDPGQEWFRPFVNRQASVGDSITQAVDGAKRSGVFHGFTPKWIEFLRTHYAAYRFPEYGLFLCLSHAQREALSDVVASPLMFQGLEKDRHAQDIALYGMELEDAIPGFSDADCKAVWMESTEWQPLRRFIEELLAARDWAEINLAINLIYEPLAAALFARELVLRFAPHHGDSVTPVIVAGAEADRAVRAESTREFVRFIVAQDEGNRDIIDGWLANWSPRMIDACRAFEPFFTAPEHPPQSFTEAFARVVDEWQANLGELGLTCPAERS